MSSVLEAFSPAGGWLAPNTVALAPAGASATGALANAAKCAQLYNSSASVIWVQFGPAGLTAAPVVPGTPGASMPVPPGACLVLEIPTTAVAWAAFGTGTIYCTTGEGL
jgi:hypothetical protein